MIDKEFALKLYTTTRKTLETRWTPYPQDVHKTDQGCSLNWLGYHYERMRGFEHIPGDDNYVAYVRHAEAVLKLGDGENWGKGIAEWNDTCQSVEPILAGWDEVIASVMPEELEACQSHKVLEDA